MSTATRSGSHELYESAGGGGGSGEKLEIKKTIEREERDEMRLSIFTSSLNYENFVSAQNLFLGVRALPLQDSSMVLGKCRRISLAPRLST